jgi:4a-hydroxytetrahydrobiopterin dehydratase
MDAMSKLNESEILDRMPSAKGWDRHGDMLVRTWQFTSFRRAIDFVNQLAILMEKEGHYPDICVSYRSVQVEMSSHDAGGLTERDFSLIGQINAISTER